MKTRIKEIRKDFNLTQSEFSDRLNISRNFIAQVELGTKEPSQRTIADICREFNVNDQWLRDGTGEKYPPKTRGTVIGEVAAAAAKVDPDQAKKFFHDWVDGISDGEILLAYELFKRMFMDK